MDNEKNTLFRILTFLLRMIFLSVVDLEHIKDHKG